MTSKRWLSGSGAGARLAQASALNPSLPLPPSSCSKALTQPSNWPAQVRVCSNTAACQQAGHNPAGPFIQPQSVHYNGVNYSASYRFTLSPASLSDQAATLRSEWGCMQTVERTWLTLP